MIVFFAIASPAFADQESAIRAYQQHDFPAAIREWLVLARKGDGPAEFALGSMYEKGEGVKVNHSVAADWYRKAAYKGLPQAQFALGMLYASGQGVSRNVVQAYSWLTLASSSGAAAAANERDELGRSMRPRQLEIAKLLTDEWEPAAETVEGLSAPGVIQHVDPDASHVGVSGCGDTITVDLIVGTSGQARDVQVVRAAGCGQDDSAIETIRKWRFRPLSEVRRPLHRTQPRKSGFVTYRNPSGRHPGWVVAL
jgi:hypothetical protein